MRSPILLLLATLALLGCSRAPKYPLIQTTGPGWYYVPAAPGFHILEDVYQILPYEPALVWDPAGANLTLAATDQSDTNIVTWTFALAAPEGRASRLLRLKFSAPLAGMKFDAIAKSETGATVTLADERRDFKDEFVVEWPDAQITEVAIRAHVHLKKIPIIKGFQLGRRVPLKDLAVDKAFQQEGMLYFFNPDGRALHLCDKSKNREMGVLASMLNSFKPTQAVVVQPK
jgi:hypothetical protein